MDQVLMGLRHLLLPDIDAFSSLEGVVHRGRDATYRGLVFLIVVNFGGDVFGFKRWGCGVDRDDLFSLHRGALRLLADLGCLLLTVILLLISLASGPLFHWISFKTALSGFRFGLLLCRSRGLVIGLIVELF
jgi:hypothetical protein